MPDLNLLKSLKKVGNGMPISIAICNDKGGSAKTTTAINLAEAMARLEFEDGESVKNLTVLLIDGDDSRTCSYWAKKRTSSKSVVNFIVCNEKEAVGVMMNNRPDVLIYDTAGGIKTNEIAELGDICHFFILPAKPDDFNSLGTFMMSDWLIKRNKRFKILISDAPSAGDFARGNDMKAQLDEANLPFFKEFIARSAKITDSNNLGRTIFEMSGAREIADSYSAVALETLEMIAQGKPRQST